MGIEPVTCYFGLTVQDKGSSDSCDDLPKYNKEEAWIYQQSDAHSKKAQKGPNGDANPSSKSINDVGGREGEYGMHEYKEETAEIDDGRLLLIDDSEIAGDGGEGVDQESRHELDEWEKEYYEVALWIEFELGFTLRSS